MPLSTAPEVAQLCTATKANQAAASLLSLVNRGTLVREKVTRPFGKNGTQQTWGYKLNPDPAQKPPVHPSRIAKPSASAQHKLTEALARVAELEAWQEAAIRKYPDLGVDPEVLEARKLVADTLRESGDKNAAEEVMAGKRDHTPLMKVAMRALGGDYVS